MKQYRHILQLSMALLLVLAMSSCSSRRGSVKARYVPTSPAATTSVVPSQRVEVTGDMQQPTRKLFTEAGAWLGTPYRYGGNDRDGVDCSGLVAQVYERALHIRLPRTSSELKEYCRAVERERIEPGDLLFFANDGRVNHVGIYLGDGNMIHASTSRGVVVTPIASNYFASRYCGAGRVDRYEAMLSPAKGRMEAAPSVRPEIPVHEPEKTPVRPVSSAVAVESDEVEIIDDFFD